MIYPLIHVPLSLYLLFILATLAAIMRVAYLLGESRPAPVLPSFRRLQVLLPFLGVLYQVKATAAGSEAILILQW